MVAYLHSLSWEQREDEEMLPPSLSTELREEQEELGSCSSLSGAPVAEPGLPSQQLGELGQLADG